MGGDVRMRSPQYPKTFCSLETVFKALGDSRGGDEVGGEGKRCENAIALPMALTIALGLGDSGDYLGKPLDMLFIL
jgi:hypothetical protein